MSTTPPRHGLDRGQFVQPASVAIGAIVLGVAVWLAVGPRDDGRTAPSRHGAALATYLPAVVEGWTARDLPVGTSPAMQKVVDSLLNYDDAVMRAYRRGDDELLVYVAWWRPGKMSPVQIAVHNPDHCWTAAGWKLRDDDSGQLEQLAGQPVLPGEKRCFESAEYPKLHALYWLLVGPRAFGYVQAARLWGLPDRIEMMVKSVFLGAQRDQIYFIRLSSRRPPEEILAAPEWRELVRRLMALNLAAPVSAPTNEKS